MLRACVLDFKGNWSNHFPLVEFAYNNSYQASIGMAPYEALYGRPCRSHTCWLEEGESSLFGQDIVRETTEKIQLIRERLRTTQSRQKSYADRRRRPLEFQEGDYVFLKVSPKNGVFRFGKKGKLVMSLKVIYFQSIFLIDFYIKRLIYMQESGINFTKLLCSRE